MLLPEKGHGNIERFYTLRSVAGIILIVISQREGGSLTHRQDNQQSMIRVAAKYLGYRSNKALRFNRLCNMDLKSSRERL